MSDYGYGLWALVVFNSLLFIVFAASFFHPQTKRDWRALVTDRSPRPKISLQERRSACSKDI